eukprot:scaffold64629_cov16-Tisochrysis_lutea.AAC.1
MQNVSMVCRGIKRPVWGIKNGPRAELWAGLVRLEARKVIWGTLSLQSACPWQTLLCDSLKAGSCFKASQP